jgi:hypothetical protein
VEDQLQRKRFLWGAVLAWVPWAPTFFGLANAFIGISNSKATGLGAVSGGLIELFATWGILTMIIGQVAAIILLYKAFSREHWMRNLVSVLSIGLSGLMLVIVCSFIWFTFLRGRH